MALQFMAQIHLHPGCDPCHDLASFRIWEDFLVLVSFGISSVPATGMMSEAPQYARYAIIGHVTHLVNRDYEVNDFITYLTPRLSPNYSRRMRRTTCCL